MPDPADPQSLNRYSYVRNNPSNFVDPSGHMEGGRACDDDYVTSDINFGVAYRGSDWAANADSLPSLDQVTAVILDLTPGVGDVKGFIEAFTGEDVVTGESLGAWRWLGLLALGELRSVRHVDEAADALGLANKAGVDEALGVVYKRTDLLTGEEYVGQTKNWARFMERQQEHAREFPDAVFSFEVLDRVEAGLALDVAEETWIRRLGGPSEYGGALANQRWQMNQTRYSNAGGTTPLPIALRRR